MKGPEAIIKDEIRAWLKAQGAYVFSPTQMGYGTQTLDLLVCMYGLFLAIEVKAPGKHPTARQLKTADEIEKAKGKAIVADSLQSCQAQLIEIVDTIEGLKDSAVAVELQNILEDHGY